MGEIEFREYMAGDEERILATFNRTFSESWTEGYVDRTLAHWRWLFDLNPAGRRIMLGVDTDGTVACQYAGIPMRVLGPDGVELSFFHAVDSMVHPDYRQGLRKRGLFLEIAERYFDRFGGHEDHLGFGYPIRAAWRIGERFLGYRLVRSLDFLVRELPMGVDAPTGIATSHIAGFSADARTSFDECWARVGARHECVTVKDARYLEWRYGSSAPHDYVLVSARRGDALAGWCVLRFTGSLVPNAAAIGDLLVAPEDGDALAALVSASAGLALGAGCESLMTVQNPELFVGRALSELGFATRPSSEWFERKLGSRDWTSGLSQEWLAANWSYCLGDSDLF